MCCLLVSGFLTEITQQIHSLRASGVISSHFACATESEMRTFRKSGGTLCTAPGELAFLLINLILLRCAVRDRFRRLPGVARLALSDRNAERNYCQSELACAGVQARV